MELDKRAFTGWPSGDLKPIMRLSMEPDELEKFFGLNFIREKDDLDYFQGSHIYIDGVGFVLFMRHLNSPQPGTPIYIDSSVNSLIAINQIIETFNLSLRHINWRLDEA